MAVDERTKDKVAAVVFAAVMAGLMGPVGIFVAALAVGIEQAWNGDAGRSAAEDLSADRVEAERQWLAEDRAWRHAQRAARQRWLAEGADPGKEPARPSGAERQGRFWRRLYARMVVLSDDFKRGFRDGWAAAKKARNDGADWRETARTRPDPDGGDAPPELVVADCPHWAEQPAHDSHTWWIDDNREYVCPGKEVPPDETPADQVELPKVDLFERDPRNYDSKQEPDNTEEPMPGPKTASDNTNLDVAERNINGLRTFLGSIDEKLDALETERLKWRDRLNQAKEHATSTGAPTATVQALDAMLAVINRLGQHLSQFATGTQQAGEELTAAKQGLSPARQAKDGLDQAGSRGKFVDEAAAA